MKRDNFLLPLNIIRSLKIRFCIKIRTVVIYKDFELYFYSNNTFPIDRRNKI